MDTYPEPERTMFHWNTSDGWQMSGSQWLPTSDHSNTLANSSRRNPVIVVHGLGEHAGRYQNFARSLTQHGHPVMAMDLRGHGKSTGVRGDTPSLLHLIDDLHVFITNAAKQFQQNVILAGHSMGGLLASIYALQYPQTLSGLFLISPYYRPAFQPQQWRLLMGRVFYYLYPGLTLNVGLQLPHLAKDEAIKKSIMNDPLSHQRLSARWAMEALEWGRSLPRLRTALQVPTTIVHGDADQVTCHDSSRFFALHQQQMAEQDPTGRDIRFQTVENGYHQIHNDSDSRAIVLEQLLQLQDRINGGDQ